MNAPASVRPTPSLRIEEMSVQGFRTFKERAVAPFRVGRRAAEPVVPFHGESNAGKSNLLAALGAFFRGADLCLASPSATYEIPLGGREARQSLARDGRQSLARDGGPAQAGAPSANVRSQHAPPISWRDRFRIDGPTEIDVRFSDARLLHLRLTAAPVGPDLRLSLAYLPPNDAPPPGHPWPADKLKPPSDELRNWLGTWLREPLGPGSRPIAHLRSCHVGSAFQLGIPDGPYPLPPFAEELYRQRTSLDPAERDLWHRFIVAVRGLPPFEHRDLSVERLEDGSCELVVEDRGRVVLRFSELSASERQALTLAAFSFLARSALLVIEYPETNLDNPMKKALVTLFQRRIDAGRIDQVFLETHETQFDGPTVLRVFRKDDRASDVVRGPSVGEAPPDIDRKGREQGAKQGWVTREGYTQLPDAMREELHLTLGGHVWFLKGKKSRWEAWPGQDLEKLFPNEDTDDRDSGAE